MDDQSLGMRSIGLFVHFISLLHTAVAVAARSLVGKHIALIFGFFSCVLPKFLQSLGHIWLLLCFSFLRSNSLIQSKPPIAEGRLLQR